MRNDKKKLFPHECRLKFTYIVTILRAARSKVKHNNLDISLQKLREKNLNFELAIPRWGGGGSARVQSHPNTRTVSEK